MEAVVKFDAIGEESGEDTAEVGVVVIEEVDKEEVSEEDVCVWIECDEVS